MSSDIESGSVDYVISVPSKATIDKLKVDTATTIGAVSAVADRTQLLEMMLSEQTKAVNALQSQVANLLSIAPKRSKIYVPLFMWPKEVVNGVRQLSRHWQAVIDAKKACPDCTIYACINVGSGDYFQSTGLWDATTFNSLTLNADIAQGVQALEGAGVEIGVYLYSDYGTRPLDVIKQRIDFAIKLFPNAKFIFVDEEKGDVANVEKYRTITAYAKSKGFSFTIGNPGASISKEAVGACDITLIYEDQGLPSVTSIDALTFGMDKKYFGAIPHSVTSYDSTLACKIMQRCGLFYATNDSTVTTTSPDSDTNPWNTTSTYLQKLTQDAMTTGIIN
jgi:hypothetical protein